jgi:hypothetical protein
MGSALDRSLLMHILAYRPGSCTVTKTGLTGHGAEGAAVHAPGTRSGASDTGWRRARSVVAGEALCEAGEVGPAEAGGGDGVTGRRARARCPLLPSERRRTV